MTRVFNLQREPETGELFAIGKSERPYRFEAVRRAEAGLARGDRFARATLIDLDLSLDEDGRPISAELLAYLRDRLRRAGWPARATRLRRLQKWEREVAMRRTWRGECATNRHTSPANPTTSQGGGSLEV